MNVIIKLKQTLKHIVINGMEYKVLGKDTPSLKQTFNISALYIYIYTHTLHSTVWESRQTAPGKNSPGVKLRCHLSGWVTWQAANAHTSIFIGVDNQSDKDDSSPLAIHHAFILWLLQIPIIRQRQQCFGSADIAFSAHPRGTYGTIQLLQEAAHTTEALVNEERQTASPYICRKKPNTRGQRGDPL